MPSPSIDATAAVATSFRTDSREVANRPTEFHPRTREPEVVVRRIAAAVAERYGVTEATLRRGRRTSTLVKARAAVCYAAAHYAGLPLRTVAFALGVSAPTVLRGTRLGQTAFLSLGIAPSDILD